MQRIGCWTNCRHRNRYRSVGKSELKRFASHERHRSVIPLLIAASPRNCPLRPNGWIQWAVVCDVRKVLQTFNIFIKSSRKIHFSARELCPAVSVCPLSRIGPWSRFVVAWVGGTQVSSRSHESSHDEDHNDSDNKMTMLRMTMISMGKKRRTQACSFTSH